MAQVGGLNGAGPYRPLVANSLLLSHFLKILVPFCAEDYQHLADYQPFSCHQNRAVEGPWGPSMARGSRYGRENGRKRSIGGPFGPPAARYGSEPCRQRSPNARVTPSPTPPAPCGAQRRRTQPRAAASKTRNHRLAIRGSAVSGEPSRAP